MPPADFSPFEQLVLGRLDRLEEQVVLVRVDVAGLKVKASLWGALSGAVPSLIAVMLVYLPGIGPT